MTALHETRRSCWTVEHLLRHCEGYHVVSMDGEVGYVETVLVSEEGEPEALAVRVGRTLTQLVPVAFGEVDDVVAASELIVAHSVSALTDGELQQRRPTCASQTVTV